ncbi:chromosome-anchoring protein RacA [Bacillus altitudinis]|uniref:chromosome-anchoring protein RacA n=1 Tax=Bacillus altitudinis TaxID=293387 RepID=UPI002117254B|nr:chromosome-anchoring protein RacA [Bacillus altitudinis]MCY7453450.1 chromosome-anchoring protein RacA [Bacillus altitudinis]MCY7580496.1 chromosome-anchoring protein RacA [Bacillus altitudinis]MCY7596278.1 chromosome-anchoring protein RacA [Bacillus altitudinis]MEC0969801.1 chromosome-anchoring protein RacA [Bacillus altitudinis]MEC1002732.1 chromosome-anchoring protein RacA [Bacillus altitudinis]
MNTNEVAKEIGVSSKTIQRWVKQLNIPVARNELGHYEFHDDIVQLLKEVQHQMNEGVILHDIRLPIHEETAQQLSPAVETSDSSKRIEALEEQVKQLLQEQSHVSHIEARFQELERKLAKKADEGVSYQLLQHRREIEELTAKLERLTATLTKPKPSKEEEKEKAHPEMKKKRVLFPLFHSFR